MVVSITMLTIFQRGKVIKMDGKGNWVNLGDLSVACITSLYNCTDGGTLMVWMKRQDDTKGGALSTVTKLNDEEKSGIQLKLNRNSKMYVMFSAR